LLENWKRFSLKGQKKFSLAIFFFFSDNVRSSELSNVVRGMMCMKCWEQPTKSKFLKLIKTCRNVQIKEGQMALN